MPTHTLHCHLLLLLSYPLRCVRPLQPEAAAWGIQSWDIQLWGIQLWGIDTIGTLRGIVGHAVPVE